MSSLIFYIDPEQVVVATDTLAVKPGSDGAPMIFCSKAIYLLHLKTIIAGTGLGNFASDWCMQVNRMVLSGIENLDFHTPGALRGRWKQFRAECSLPADLTTTVYYFGFSEESGTVHAYAYRSTNDFRSERLGYGFGLKPECTPPTESISPEALQRMMREQRTREAAKPASERLYIGGEGIAIHLTKANCTTSTVFQFEDFPAQLEEAFRNHRKEGALTD